MNALDFFFEGLGHSKTKEILEQENVPFSFLARKIGREHVVSFLDDHNNVQHQILPVPSPAPTAASGSSWGVQLPE